LLEDRLVAVGYFDAHAERYPRRFAVVGTLIIEVSETFPRLTIGRIPLGITRAMYDIDLDKVVGRRVDVVTALQEMEAI